MVLAHKFLLKVQGRSQIASTGFGEPLEKGGKVVWTRQSPSNTLVCTSVEPQSTPSARG